MSSWSAQWICQSRAKSNELTKFNIRKLSKEDRKNPALARFQLIETGVFKSLSNEYISRIFSHRSSHVRQEP